MLVMKGVHCAFHIVSASSSVYAVPPNSFGIDSGTICRSGWIKYGIMIMLANSLRFPTYVWRLEEILVFVVELNLPDLVRAED